MTVHPAVTETPLPEWSLSDLYSGRDDPAIERDLQAASELVKRLGELQGAFLAARGEADQLGLLLAQAVGLYEQGANLLGAVGAYAGLQASVARDDPDAARFEADVRARSAAIGAETLWFTLELNQIDEPELEAAYRAQPDAERWRPWLRRVRAMKPHELSPELERMVADRAPAVAGWSRLFDETLARSLNTLAFEKQVEDRWRKFATPAASRHLANEVDAEAVDALEAAVVDAYPRLSHRYYALKAKALGRDALDYWDRNAPLTEAPVRRYDWEEAKGIVLDSYNSLSPRFADTARAFLEQPWTDARPRPGKQSGAFSHPVTSERHPYVLMNYMGERRDVLTLAHELGHAVHQTLAAPAGTLLADTPLTLAETASIFGEGLVFERLLGEATPEERRALLAGKIEDGLNTVVRQISFHRFETRFHDRRREGELSPDEIGRLWLDIMAESLGPAITLNPGYEHYWGYVSHFVHAPFYVYAYAFGDLLVSALMEKRREDPAAFAPLYEQLLAGGGARTYTEALKPFGLDPREKSFWAQGCARLERLVDEFEALD
jgi:oligoendopeptidase F